MKAIEGESRSNNSAVVAGSEETWVGDAAGPTVGDAGSGSAVATASLATIGAYNVGMATGSGVAVATASLVPSGASYVRIAVGSALAEGPGPLPQASSKAAITQITPTKSRLRTTPRQLSIMPKVDFSVLYMLLLEITRLDGRPAPAKTSYIRQD